MHLSAAISIPLLWLSFASCIQEPPEVLVVTVATEETDGLKRLLRSAYHYDIQIQVYGLGETWNGGDTRVEQGGGQKINILKKELEKFKEDKNLLILFVDAYDVVFSNPIETILRRFLTKFQDARILFGAEPYCWPDASLVDQYPLVEFGKRFLNSGLYLGYAPEIYKLLTLHEVKDSDDDQLYFTKAYLDKKTRDSLKIELDTASRIFQNLNGAQEDVELEFDDETGEATAYNANYNTHPVVIHGNGPSKRHLDYLANYIGQRWNGQTGCGFCGDRSHLNLEETPKEDYPLVTLAIFIAKPIPFTEEFFQAIFDLDYPKDKLALYIYNSQPQNIKMVFDIFEKEGPAYYTKKISNGADRTEREAREIAIQFHQQTGSKFFFTIDADMRSITIPKSSPHSFTSPARCSPTSGEPLPPMGTTLGARTTWPLLKIRNRKGVWQAPFIGAALLMTTEKLAQFAGAYNYKKELDPDMSFCAYARDHGHFMYVTNEEPFGFLIVADEYAEILGDGHLHPEMWEIFENRELWEQRYLHPKYKEVFEADTVPQACPDVYDYPLMSERYCAEIIEEMEHFGKWSDGTNLDKRLQGGYENVPTRDIHMKQIGYARHWLYFLNEYVRPMQEKVFTGYYQNPVHSEMMFVVRYKPDEQASLRPHHDASTYSVDIALNKKGVDYEGGGVRYPRYNCTVPADEVGYTMMFPGRLTHLHEGLPTTSGTRYILVSFINP
ncbi:unnamed protein product, partial [Mesorhabditis spiculigera]